MVEFINELKRDQKKIILAAVIFGVVVFLDFAFVVKAQVKSVAAGGKKIVALKKDIETLTKELALIQQSLKKSKEAMKLRPFKIYSEGEIPLLLQEVSVKAMESEVKVMQINTAKEAKAKDKTGFIPVAIKLDLVSGYHSLGRFLNILENGAQPIFAEEIRISRDSGDFLKHRVSLSLKTYVKK